MRGFPPFTPFSRVYRHMFYLSRTARLGIALAVCTCILAVAHWALNA